MAISVAMNIDTDQPLPKIALIAGPTASGKSDIALMLAKLLPVTIINADASQVYSDLRILSARPTPAQEAQTPHQLFGYVDGVEAYSAARWSNDARGAIMSALNQGRFPVLVGGSGLYIRTLIDGIAPIPEIITDVRKDVRSLDVNAAHHALTREDPEAAARLSPNDRSRVARALEVVRSTGNTLKAWQVNRVGGIGAAVNLIPLILLPPRDWLFARCDARFEAMIKSGAMEEVEALFARRLDPALPVMRAIGVCELAKNDVSAAQLATRQYAKRQYTWFRNQPPSHWQRFENEITTQNTNDLVIMLRDTLLT